MKADSTDYTWLLDGLTKSRERWRVMQVSGEQQNVDLAKAFYCIDPASAATNTLLAEPAQNPESTMVQPFNMTT